MLTPRVSSWITARRLRAHGFILALCLWSVYVWNMATPCLLDLRRPKAEGAPSFFTSILSLQWPLQHAPAPTSLHRLCRRNLHSPRRVVPAAAGITIFCRSIRRRFLFFFAPLRSHIVSRSVVAMDLL